VGTIAEWCFHVLGEAYPEEIVQAAKLRMPIVWEKIMPA